MSDFDKDLRDAVKFDAGNAHLATAGDEGIFEQMAATFRGRMRFWVVLTWILTAVITGVCVWAAVMFFNADDVRDWIMYAAIFLMGGNMVGLLKMWNYMEMHRNTHTREIKRLELQIAQMRAEQRTGSGT